MESEQWKICVKNSNYEVSSEGRVRRCTRGSSTHIGKILKPSTSNCGYRRLILYDDRGGYKNHPVHRLVLETFTGSCPDGMECNHKDGNKVNNSIENLEWVTKSDNQKHASRTGLHVAPRGERHYKAKLTNDQVRNIRELYFIGYPQERLVKITGVAQPSISNIVRYKTYGR